MKILLIQPPHHYGTGNREPAYFPLGLGYIARVLLDKGHEVEVFDINALGLSKDQVIERIKTLDYDIAGISALSMQYKHVKWLAKSLKDANDKPIILGNTLAMFSHKIVLNNTDVDVCVMGEGEIIFPNLIENMDHLHKVKGIAFKENNKIIETLSEDYIKDLDSLPFPAWDLFPMDVYLNVPMILEGYGKKSLNVISARGCPYRCKYCSKTFKGVRMRSVDNVISEIKELIDRFGVEVIAFSEELVMINQQRMEELCEKIKPLNVTWVCEGRVNVATYDILKKMREAGCVRVGYGIESGSQKILDLMRKDAKVEVAEKALKDTVKAGIIPVIQMMFGYPGEDDESLNETVEFCKRAHVHMQDQLFTTTPLPGTDLYDDVLKKGLIKDEEKYLENLQGTRALAVNMTEWSDEVFLRKKKETEKKIMDNYYAYRRRHPFVFLKDYSYKVKRGLSYVRQNGIVKTYKNARHALKHNPGLIFQAEYK